METNAVVRLDASKVRVPEGSFVDQKRLSELVPNIAAIGQQQPILAYEQDGEYVVYDGVHRTLAKRELGQPVAAIVTERPESEADMIRKQLGCNQVRRRMSHREVASKVCRVMELQGLATQKQAADFLGLSEASISRSMNWATLSPAHVAAMEGAGVAPSIQSLIPPLPTEERRDDAVRFACTPVDGRLPTREAVQRYIERFRKKPGGRAPKARKLRLKAGSREIVLQCAPGETGEHLIESLKAAIERIKASRDLPVEALGFVLK